VAGSELGRFTRKKELEKVEAEAEAEASPESIEPPLRKEKKKSNQKNKLTNDETSINSNQFKFNAILLCVHRARGPRISLRFN